VKKVGNLKTSRGDVGSYSSFLEKEKRDIQGLLPGNQYLLPPTSLKEQNLRDRRLINAGGGNGIVRPDGDQKNRGKMEATPEG